MATPLKRGPAQLAKEILGLAGEYGVASELARRTHYAQLTLGNHKRTDILIDDGDGKMLCVQVKAKQGREWPGCKGVCGDNIVLVLVDYENKQREDRPDFYILIEADWRKFLEEISPAKLKLWNMKWGEDLVPHSRKDVVGTSVRPAWVIGCKETWGKIEELLHPRGCPVSGQ